MRRSSARTPTLYPINPNPGMDSIKSIQFKQTTNTRSNSFSKMSKNPSKSNLLIVSLTAIALSIFIYLLFIFLGSKSSRKFSIIIDGGSTGSRIHVFEYKVKDGMPKFDFGPDGLGSMRVNPGLSSYADDPERAGGSIVGLVEFGKDRVPKELWEETEIRLMATAGLRLLDLKVQERIMESCRRVLKSSGFKFQDDWASVITGSDEGLYAWVVANYALGSLGSDPLKTTGIIELGGASAQVTFATSEQMLSQFSRSLKFGNITYNLYSHSWLHFGQSVAFDSLRELLVSNSLTLSNESPKNEVFTDPCIPKGYNHYAESRNLSPGSLSHEYSSSFQAVGNFSECRAAALMLLKGRKEKCSHERCTLGPAFMPRLHGSFLATENFFYTSKFFGLGPKAVLSDLMIAGQQFCEEEWSNIKRKYPSLHEEDLLRYCFSSAYIVAFLHDSLGVALDDQRYYPCRKTSCPHFKPILHKFANVLQLLLSTLNLHQSCNCWKLYLNRVRYTNQVENIPLDWALGAFILQSTANMDVEHPEWITSILGDGPPNLILLFIASMILMFVAWSVSNWRKPYLKTIYDLEKGRYIVTRISR